MSSEIHHHDHDSNNEMSFDEKLMKLLSHWIKHNEEHALNYRKWAEKAKVNGRRKAAGLLEDAAEMSLATNGKFTAALVTLGKE